MRSWTLHPELLHTDTDCKTYVANWGETLQGLGAIQGKHKMHINHPQLNRFKQQGVNCESAMYTFLFYLFLDSRERLTPTGKRFKFDVSKIDIKKVNLDLTLPVSLKQLKFEINHLNSKRLEKNLPVVNEIKLHPMFYLDDNYIDVIEKGDKI